MLIFFAQWLRNKIPIGLLFLFAGIVHGEQIQQEELPFEKRQYWEVKITHIEPKNSNDRFFFHGIGKSDLNEENISIAGNILDPPSIEPPFFIATEAILRTPQKSEWPGGYSEDSYYKRKGWVGRLDIRRVDSIHMIRPSKLEKLRNQLNDRLKRNRGSGFSKRLARALVFGEGKALSKSDRTPFQNSGTAHILAVSGLHVGMVYLLVLLASGWIPKIRVRLWIHLILTVVILLAYSWFTGMSPSVIRSSLMFIAWALADALQRRRFSLNGLWFAALVSLCYQPLWLFSPGLHLSYAAVASILIGFKNWPIPAKWPKWKRRVASMASVTLFAQMGTLGLSLYYFGIFPVYFFPANLIFTPLTPVLLYGAWINVLVPYPIVTYSWTFLSEGYQWGLTQLTRLPNAVFNVNVSTVLLLAIALLLWGLLARIRAHVIAFVLFVFLIGIRLQYWYDQGNANRPVLYTVDQPSCSAVINVNEAYFRIKQDTLGFANFLEEQFLAEKRTTLFYYPAKITSVSLGEKIGPLGPEEKDYATWTMGTGWYVEGEPFRVRQKVRAYRLP